MKRTLLVVIAVLAVALGANSLSWALDGASGPHTDYRSGYGAGCSGNAACHAIAKGSFMPAAIDQNAALNFTNFCVTCHNASGEAHDKAVGSPSTNAYVNATGIDKSQSFGGNSHNWNGASGNAGTRVPVAAGFGGTGHMPGGKVACQTCHNGPIKNVAENFQNWSAARSGNSVDYSFNFTGKKEYLAKYLSVYRSATPVSMPTNTRTKKTYLVDPSEYTFDWSTNTVHFKRTQTGATTTVYAEIAEPYLRVSNASNAMCLDCHNDRLDVQVSHEPGTGAKDNHPVGVNLANNFGRTTTIKATSSGNAYIEAGQVLCTSCHDVHNASSKNGQALRETDASALCADCHKTSVDGFTAGAAVNAHNGAKHSTATVCLDCHTTHGSKNIMLIKNVINGKTINFKAFSSMGKDTGSGVCEACHTATSYHKANGTGTGHNTGKNCTQCHPHSAGFAPAGGSCDSCHGFPPSPTKGGPTGWADADGDSHASHITHFADAAFGINVSGNDACAICHGDPAVPASTHNTGKDNANINSANWAGYRGNNWGSISFSNGTTIGKVNTWDDTCTNVSCHGSAGTRQWKKASSCNSCHFYPDNTSAAIWAVGNGHNVRHDGVNSTHMLMTGYNADTDTYAAMTADTDRCGKCHPNVTANHQNGVVNMRATGPSDAACGGGGFTISVVTSRTEVHCSNVRCHASKDTLNWW